jgi:hypothetical protein
MAKGIFYDTIRLCGGHSLIMGHRPVKLSMADISKKLEEDPQEICQFGLFDVATPNYTTYYPEVTAEDLHPKDDEFIEPVFRMLSNITVHASHNPIHFPSDALKKSMYKLIGQTVNIDHEMAVGNAIGSVKSVEWQNEYSTKDGIKIPAGINATLRIDGKSNPRIARGIMMDPPSIHANSVTVNFAWKKSHEEMNDEDFRAKLGTFDDKGKLIQRIVTDILAYHETSLVSHGADPFAQKVNKNGEIVKPAYAKSRYPLSDPIIDSDNTGGFIYYDWKQFSTDGFDSESHNLDINNNQTQFEMKETLLLLEKIFGLSEGTLTEENYEEKLKALNTELGTLRAKVAEPPAPVKVLDLEGLQSIETEITALRTFKSEVPDDYKAKIALGEIGNTAISELKEDTKRLYKLSVEAGKEDATILATLDAADYKTLQAFHKQYDQLTDGKYNLTCTKCGTGDYVTRASAKPANDKDLITNKGTAELIEDNTSVRKVNTEFIEGPKK